jgi:molybdopterin converting factor small subunit
MRQTDQAGVAIRIPGSLRPLTGDERVVKIRGTTVGDVLARLVDRYPALRPRLRDERGHLRPSVLIFLNSEDIRAGEGEGSAVGDGDELDIVPVADGG